MFSHVMVGANDIVASKRFYDAVLGAIGVPEGRGDPKGRVFYRAKSGVFGITKPIDGQVATHANGGTIGFACDSPEKVKAFHDAGVANGGESIEDPPDVGVEEAWAAEIERRMTEFRAGRVKTIPWSEVKQRLFRDFD